MQDPRSSSTSQPNEESELNHRDRLAIERTQLANERTVLAYVRTAILLGATGVTLMKLHADNSWIISIGWVFVFLGVFVLYLGFTRFRRFNEELRRLS